MYTYLFRDKMEKLEAGQAKFEEEMGAKKALEKALEVRAEHEKTDPELRALTFLYESYEPKFWWFEIFETGRKLCLTGFLVFLAPGTTAQVSHLKEHRVSLQPLTPLYKTRTLVTDRHEYDH